MAIYGVLFDNQKPTAKNIGAAFAPLLTDGAIAGWSISTEGGTIRFNTGVGIVCGRIIEFTTAQTVTVSGTGVCRVLLTIDLNSTASATTFEQVVLSTETVAVADEFAALTQQNINRTGKIYQIELCRYTVNNGSIVKAVAGLPMARPKINESNVFMGNYYGDSLPKAGNVGRIFFLKQV